MQAPGNEECCGIIRDWEYNILGIKSLRDKCFWVYVVLGISGSEIMELGLYSIYLRKKRTRHYMELGNIVPRDKRVL